MFNHVCVLSSSSTVMAVVMAVVVRPDQSQTIRLLTRMVRHENSLSSPILTIVVPTCEFEFEVFVRKWRRRDRKRGGRENQLSLTLTPRPPWHSHSQKVFLEGKGVLIVTEISSPFQRRGTSFVESRINQSKPEQTTKLDSCNLEHLIVSYPRSA